MCFHSWSKWVTTKTGKLMDGGIPCGFYIIQEKTCSKCNMIKSRLERTDE